MSANYEAASAEGEISCGFLNFIFNDEAASSSYGDIITNSYQDAIMKKEPAAIVESNSPIHHQFITNSSRYHHQFISDTYMDPQLYDAAVNGTYMDPQLCDAAVKGNIEPFDTVRELNSIVTPNKNTILHINIMKTASIKFVEDILDKCPSLLRQVNVNDETPLHIAAKYGHSDIVDILINRAKHEDLESGTRVIGMINNDRDTALHVAVRYEHLDVVKILTKNDPHFSYSSNKHGETPLYIAAEKNSFEIVVEILETCTLPAYEGPNQMTALHAAARNDSRDISRQILEKKKRNQDGWTRSQYDSYHENRVAMEVLEECDVPTADIDLTKRKLLEEMKSLIKERDQYGWTPLHYAAYYGNCESMEALLEYDVSTAYIGDKDRKMTPLHIAIGRGYIPHKLISSCPDCFELVDKRRQNVLHFAMLSLNFEDLKILLKDPLIKNLIHDKDVDGNTPLHLLATIRKDLIQKIGKMNMDIKLDLHVVNNQNISVSGMMMKSDRRRQRQQEILKLEEPVGPYQYGVVRVNQELVYGGYFVKEKMEKVRESHLIVAGLIATVTFTAAFTLPGGVIQDGDKEGTAILSKKAAFQAFVIADAIAMVLSLSALFAHFLMPLHTGVNTSKKKKFLAMYGARSIVIAMVAMVIAFVTGTYAMLTTSLGLANLTTFIGFSFFLLMFLIWRRVNHKERRVNENRARGRGRGEEGQ